MNENRGILFGFVYSSSQQPVEGALVEISRGSNLRVSGESGKGKDPSSPSATTDDAGRFVIEFAWDAADIATGEGVAHFSFRLWAHTEEFPKNWGQGNTTAMGSSTVNGYMFRNPQALNVFPDMTSIAGLSSTLRSMVFKFNKVKFPGFRWLPRAGRMSTENWLVVGGGEIYLNS